MPKLTIYGSVLACLALAACGGSGDDEGAGGGRQGAETEAEEKTFEGDGYSFSYPAAWTGGEEAGEAGGGLPTVAVIPVREGTDGVYLTVGSNPRPVTADNFERIRDEYVDFYESFIAQDQGRLTSEPTRATLDGLPALRFEGTVVTAHGDTARFRATTAFDGPTFYYINCQFVPGGEDVERGCDQVLQSFQVE